MSECFDIGKRNNARLISHESILVCPRIVAHANITTIIFTDIETPCVRFGSGITSSGHIFRKECLTPCC